MFKEYEQLNDLNVFESVNPDELTSDEKHKALRAINLIKEKRCGKIKGRTVADGRPTRKYIPREEATSPTIALESLFATLIIDAQEGRAVQTFDVPGAYLHAKLPATKRVLMKLTGTFVDIMCEVNPGYLKYARLENGKKVLYLRILKAIYGMIESALLWYELYSTTLVKMGFEINPYDKCVANKIIDDSQCTICWYVDDNKVSHLDDKVNDSIVDAIEKKFGKLARTTGKKHTFLGMDIEFIGDKKLSITTPQHIEEALEDFGEEIDADAVNPAKSKLFIISNDSEKLSEAKADIFHSITAKLLWVGKRARPDLETAVSFLCTRVQAPTVEDWGKLKRVLKFLKKTKSDRRIMGGDDILKLETWVDASYAIHDNMRGHTGGAMSFGWGVVHEKAAKQKLNTKSSTESEVVGVSEYVPHKIQMINFIDAQGYKLKKCVLYQDNQSSIKMEKNGRNSCTGNSRHISIRYFFVKDRVDKGEFTIEYCPTECMLADFFTKPLQGALFIKFREVVMGWKHVDTLKRVVLPPSEERVENSADGDKAKIAHEPARKSYAEAVTNAGNRKPEKLVTNSNNKEGGEMPPHGGRINKKK